MTHSRSIETVYLAPQFVNHDAPDSEENGGYYDFDEFLEDLGNVVQEKYPSFTKLGKDSKEDERECFIVLENGAAQISVSEYCGLISVGLVPRAVDWGYDNSARVNAMRQNWTAQIAANFKKHLHKRFSESALISQGHASNGEQFFRPVNRPEGCVTSKEGTLW
jgi:hypothetical protein